MLRRSEVWLTRRATGQRFSIPSSAQSGSLEQVLSAVTEEEGRNESLSSPALVIISTKSKAKRSTRESKFSGKITKPAASFPVHYPASNLCGNHKRIEKNTLKY